MFSQLCPSYTRILQTLVTLKHRADVSTAATHKWEQSLGFRACKAAEHGRTDSGEERTRVKAAEGRSRVTPRDGKWDTPVDSSHVYTDRCRTGGCHPSRHCLRTVPTGQQPAAGDRGLNPGCPARRTQACMLSKGRRVFCL